MSVQISQFTVCSGVRQQESFMQVPVSFRINMLYVIKVYSVNRHSHKFSFLCKWMKIIISYFNLLHFDMTLGMRTDF